MSLAVVLKSLLLADAGIQDVVGTRVYLGAWPKHGRYPCIQITVPSDVPDEFVPSFSIARIQCSCWSDVREVDGVKAPTEAEEVAAAVKALLHGTRLQRKGADLWTDGTTSYLISDCRCVSAPLLWDTSGLVHIPVDFLIEYRIPEVLNESVLDGGTPSEEGVVGIDGGAPQGTEYLAALDGGSP